MIVNRPILPDWSTRKDGSSRAHRCQFRDNPNAGRMFAGIGNGFENLIASKRLYVGMGIICTCHVRFISRR